MTTAINYLHGDIDPDREEEAFIKLANYLVLKGQYKDEAAARKDAEQRVDFLEKADIYADDPKMDNALVRVGQLAIIGLQHIVERVGRDQCVNGFEFP